MFIDRSDSEKTLALLGATRRSYGAGAGRKLLNAINIVLSWGCSRRTLPIIVVLVVCTPAVPAQTGWVPKRIGPVGKDLNTVYFLDSKRGWVGGDDGYLSRTDDGGQSWAQQLVGTKDGINDIYFR